MLRSLNFKHIFYFWAVAKHSSISKAASILNVSQSSISEQLKVLEATINNHLFDRSQKKMVLTSNGQVLYKTLDEFFPAIEEIIESIANYKTSNVKFLRIGFCPTLTQETRHKLSFGLIEDYHYTVKILQGENQFLLEAFNKDEIDLIFTTNDKMIPKGKYEKYTITKKRYCIVTNAKIAGELPRRDKIAALNNYKFVNYTPDSDLHFKFSQYIQNKGINPIRIAEIDDISIIKSTILAMDCFSILPTTAVRKELKEKQLFQVGPIIKEINCKITAIYKPNFKSKRFLDHLNDIPKSI